MDNFEIEIKKGRDEMEPSENFVDRVMDEIEKMENNNVTSISNKRRNFILITSIAASIILVLASFFAFNTINGSDANKQLADKNTTTTSTTTTVKQNIDPKVQETVDEFDAAITNIGKELNDEVASNIDTSGLDVN